MIHSIGWPSRPQSWPMNEQSAASHPAPGVCKNITNWNCHDVSRPGSWFHTPARSLGDFLDMTNILGRPSENVLVTAICRGFQGKLAFASSRRQRPNEPKGRRIYNPEFNHPPSPMLPAMFTAKSHTALPLETRKLLATARAVVQNPPQKLVQQGAIHVQPLRT